MKISCWKRIAMVTLSPEREIPCWRLDDFMYYSFAAFGGVTVRISSRNELNTSCWRVTCFYVFGFPIAHPLAKKHVRFYKKVFTFSILWANTCKWRTISHAVQESAQDNLRNWNWKSLLRVEKLTRTWFFFEELQCVVQVQDSMLRMSHDRTLILRRLSLTQTLITFLGFFVELVVDHATYRKVTLPSLHSWSCWVSKLSSCTRSCQTITMIHEMNSFTRLLSKGVKSLNSWCTCISYGNTFAVIHVHCIYCNLFYK